MKIFKYIISIIMLVIIGLSLGSCRGFIPDTSLEIESIKTETLSDGTTRVTISYTDTEIKPVVFDIPKGKDGENGRDGVGITGIRYETMNDGKTKVYISYSDNTSNPTEIILNEPAHVINIEYKVDPISKNTLVYFHFSNGFVSEPVRVMKGNDGIGIKDIKTTKEEDGSVIVEMLLTNDNNYKFTIPAPLKGDEGNGIKSIMSYEDANYYYLEIAFTHDVPNETFRFTRPTNPNNWYSGSTDPDKNPNLGNTKDGDYYFDLYHDSIYIMQNGKWELVVGFDSEFNNEHKVTFNLNDSTSAPASMPSNQLSYYVRHGEYFSSCGDEIPVPTRDGYTFTGWTTDKTINPTTSYLTKLTPICDDLTFYAQWTKN